MQRPVYLDYNATTPVDPAVVEAMVPYLSERFGNASSTHSYGFEAHEALEAARAKLATLLNCNEAELVFAGGATECNNLAIKGIAFARLNSKPHIVSTTVEHPAVANVLAYLKGRFDADFTLVPVDDTGLVSPDAIRKALRPETVLVSVIHANNEVGTIQPLAEIADITREAGLLLHTDASQSAGKVPVDVNALGVDLLTVAGHKLYGPKGIGALYIRPGVMLDPVVHGSGQEHGLRAGTENVASIVGFGKAAEIAASSLTSEPARLSALRDRLFELLADRIPEIRLNGHPVHRLPNTLNVSFPGVSGQTVLGYAPGVAASTGSACHSADAAPSSVLTAMGYSAERAAGAVRLSLGRWSTEEDVEVAGQLLGEAYESARKMSLSFA